MTTIGTISQAFFLFLLLSTSFAAITGMDVSGSVDAPGNSRLVVEVGFSGSEGEEEYIVMSGPVDEVLVRDRSGLIIEHHTEASGNDTLIYATVPYDYLRFDISSDSFTAKDGPLWGLDLAMGASDAIGSFSSTISLPSGASLKSTNGAVESDGGSLSLSWQAQGIGALHKLRMKASYEVGTPLQSDYSMLLAMGAVVLASVAAVSYLMRGRVREEPKAQAPQPSQLESNTVFKTLDETDKEIVREMSRQGGKTTQAHLYLHTHVPKATLSRRLASLENKGLVQKSQKGNRNLVTLTDILVK